MRSLDESYLVCERPKFSAMLLTSCLAGKPLVNVNMTLDECSQVLWLLVMQVVCLSGRTVVTFLYQVGCKANQLLCRTDKRKGSSCDNFFLIEFCYAVLFVVYSPAKD